MSNILEIQKRLRDTYAAMSKLTGPSTASPDSKSRRVVQASLNKRKRRLEKKYKDALAENGIEVCSYQISGEVRPIPQPEE